MASHAYVEQRLPADAGVDEAGPVSAVFRELDRRSRTAVVREPATFALPAKISRRFAT